MTRQKINIVQPESKEEKVPLDILATHIREVSRLGKNIERSAMKQETIVILLHESTRVPKGSIRQILEALPELERKYLK